MNTATPPRYSREEFAQRGQEIYAKAFSPDAEAAHTGAFVAIDIESGGYELDADDFQATERLLGRLPNAQIWLARVGQAAAYRMGGTRRGI